MCWWIEVIGQELSVGRADAFASRPVAVRSKCGELSVVSWFLVARFCDLGPAFPFPFIFARTTGEVVVPVWLSEELILCGVLALVYVRRKGTFARFSS